MVRHVLMVVAEGRRFFYHETPHLVRVRVRVRVTVRVRVRVRVRVGAMRHRTGRG